MAELPILPITAAALVADTTHMSPEEFGAYVRILLAMWGNGAELIDDDPILARIAGVSLKRWQTIRRVVLGPVSVTDGMLHQKRLSKTWDTVQKIRVKRVSASKERWNQKRLRDAHAYAQPMQKPSTNDPHGMQLKLKEDITTTSRDTARASQNGQNPPENEPKVAKPQGSSPVAAAHGFAEQARQAVQQSSGQIGSGELAASIQAKRWVP